MRRIRISNSALFILGLSLTQGLDPAQAVETGCRLRYIGHATVLIQGKAATVLTDPFWGEKILWGLKRKIPPALQPGDLPPIDLVLISHTHPDHCDYQALQTLRSKPLIVMPWEQGKKMSRVGFQAVELHPWQVYTSKEVKITAIPARHMFGHCLGYLIEMDGKKIYFTGDTKLHPDLSRLEKSGIDLMLLPYGGYPVLGSIWTTNQAIEAVRLVNPRMVIPIHWGTFSRWWTSKEPETPDQFMTMLNQTLEAVQAKKLAVGEQWNL